MAISKDFLWATIERVTTELETVTPDNVIAARTRGLLEARKLAFDRPSQSPRNHSADPERDERAVELYQRGMSLLAVATECGCSTGPVLAALKRHGVPTRPRGRSQKAAHEYRSSPRVERIRAMREEGKTLEEIGAVEKITRERVRQICLRAGIDTSRRERELTPEELAIVGQYVGGDSIYLVAERNNITTTELKKIILLSGNEVRPSRRTQKHYPDTIAKAEHAAQLYQAGKTCIEIGAALNIAPPMTYRLLAIAGVKPNRKPFGRKSTDNSISLGE